MNLYIKQTGITDTNSDAIVNAANSSLLKGGGVCGVIFNAAGSEQLSNACHKIGHCDCGDAVITPGFKLSKYIIHAVGPIYHDGNHNEAIDLYNCYIRSLDLAIAYNCTSITFPLISAGIYGYPTKEAFTIALKACKDWDNKNNHHNIDIIFAIPEKEKYLVGLQTASLLDISINN